MFDITDSVVQLLGSPQLLDGAAELSAESDLVAAATITAFAEVSLSAESDLTAEAEVVFPLFASLSGSSDLTASITLGLRAESRLSAQSNLVATSSRLIFVQPRKLRGRFTARFTILVGHPVQARPLRGSARLTGTIYTQPRVLVLPTVRYTYTENVLLRRYAIENGRSLLITGSQGVIGDFFAQDQIEDADFYFGGGRRHELNPEEEAAVVAAGYGDLIVTEFLS